jgi:hypothetical protein
MHLICFKQRLLWDYSQAPGLRKKEIGADLHTSKNKQNLALVIMINGGWTLIAAVKRQVLLVQCGTYINMQHHFKQ